MLFINQLELAAIWIITIGLLVSGGVGMLLRSAPPAKPAEPAADGLSFAPIVELTVFDDGNRHDECIDFDKGKTISGPQGSFKTREEGARWFRESGADCHCETQTGESGLYPVQTWMIPVERETWDQITPAELQTDMQSPPTRPVVSAEGELPATFVFKTRDGAIGVGQIVEMDRGGADEHGTMKVRFKLTQVSGK